MKVRCSGPGKHVNVVDLDELLKDGTIYKRTRSSSRKDQLRDRYIVKCDTCGEEVVVTRKMIEAHQKRS